MAIQDHARKEKRDQFVARINAMRATVLNPEIQDEGVLPEDNEQHGQPATTAPSNVNTVIIKKITDEVRAELKKKKAETKWTH